MSPSITPNPLSVPVSLQTTQSIQPTPAVSRGNSTALTILGSIMLAIAVAMGVFMTAGAAGAFDDVVRSVKAALGPDETLTTEQQRHAAAIAGLDRRVHAVTLEIGNLTSRAQLARYHDAAVSDRFTTLETDIAALTAELRALRSVRNEASGANGTRQQIDFLEATVVEVGSGVTALRSSLDAFAETHRKDIADLAETHRKDITDISKRLDRVEQVFAAREVTGSIRNPVRKAKVRKRRPAATVARVPDGMAPFQPVPASLLSWPCCFPQ